MKIISVIPLKKGVLQGDLTYFTGLNISPGSIVSVPIRKKIVLALVTSAEELKENKSNVRGMNFNLRKAVGDKGTSIFLKEFWQAAFDTCKYFAQNKNNTISTLIPNIFLENYDKLIKLKTAGEGGKQGEKNEKNLRTEKLLFQYPLADRMGIYKTLVRESFARGKSVFVVLPTESDIDKFSGELARGIEQFTFAMHSGISAKKNLSSYEEIMTLAHPVLIIGTAPFLSIPKKNIGTIILEHEYSNAYRTIRKPHVDLRVFVEIYAAKIGAKFIAADQLLRYETLGRAEADSLNPLHPLSYRVDFEGGVDISEKEVKKADAKFRIFKDKALEEIKSAIKNKKNVFIFSLRKGLSTMTVCHDCGETLSCDRCGALLVLYQSELGKKRIFVCNRCEREIQGDTVCASCGSWNLVPLGIGTDTVYEEAKRLFSQNKEKLKIFKLDRESARSASGAKKIIKDFEASSGAILVGTEMAFFYLKEKVPLSVVASFDSLWSIPSFRMSERIIQIVLSIIDNTKDKLIIQTKNEKDGALLAIKSENLLSFVRGELSDRKKMDYPPYKRFIKITHLGDREQTAAARKMLREIFKEYSPEIFSGFIARLKGKYVTNMLLKIDPQKWSLPEISADTSIDEKLLSKLYSLPLGFEVFVDPEDLL